MSQFVILVALMMKEIVKYEYYSLMNIIHDIIIFTMFVHFSSIEYQCYSCYTFIKINNK